jgi:ribosomal protein S18 acetylase RimI-like enzyme
MVDETRKVLMIRRREDADLPGCVESLRRVHRTDRYPVRWPADPTGWLQPQHSLDAWVADRDGAVAGHAMLRIGTHHADAEYWTAATGLPDSAHGLVTRLWTDPTARGLGAGRALLERVAGEARWRGLYPVLDVMAHNEGAIALYESLGWRRVRTCAFAFPDGTKLPMHVYVGPPDARSSTTG